MALLLCALATPVAALALFAESRSHFYRPWGSHDWNSSASLALAENLSVERGLLRFHRLPVDEVSVYNRFPVGGLALIRLAIAPFEGLGAKVLAARVLMLTLFAAAALLAYLALRRIVGDPWIAAGATALACSSFYCVYYSDMISTEVAMDLFAVMLVWHGLALYVQDGRFRQLVVKICLALLIRLACLRVAACVHRVGARRADVARLAQSRHPAVEALAVERRQAHRARRRGNVVRTFGAVVQLADRVLGDASRFGLGPANDALDGLSFWN